MAEDKKQKADPLKYAGKYKRLIILGCALSAAASIINMIPYICIWKIVDLIFRNYGDAARAEGLTRYGWIAFGVSVLGVIVYCTGLMCTHIAAFNTARIMRSKALHHLVRLPLGYFSRHSSGSIRRTIDDSAGLTETYIAHRLPDFAGAITAPIAMLMILFWFDWRLGLCSLVPIAVGFVALAVMMGKSVSSGIGEYQRALDAMNGEAVEYVRGMAVVKTFQQSVYSMKRFMKTIDDYARFAIDYCHSFRNGKSVFDVASNSVYALLIPAAIVLVGACASMQGFQNILVNIIFYILFTPYLSVLMTKIMFTSEDMMIAQLAVEKIEAILNEAPLAEPGEEAGVAGNAGNGADPYEIEFCGVRFAYDEAGEDVIKGVDLRIPQGKTIALVGPSGGGKSTLAKLIPRFYDVTAGSIRIGGVDVRDMHTEALMKQIAFVFQQSHLFKESLRENVLEAASDASPEAIQSALDAAQCGEIVEKLPNGLDTVVGTKGVYLSGGEVQRIALARAILKDAPIVLLDEATAFADPENEYKIQKAFSALARGKTVLMIAHRLSTVRNVDKICVIDEGRVAEEGTHEELLRKGGLYARMWADYQKAADWKLGTEEGRAEV